MRFRHIYLRVLFCILLPVFGNIQARGNGTTYYARGTATVSSASPTGSGTVYISTTNNSSGTYQTTSSATGQNDSQGNSANVTFYAFAQANDNYEFVGWNTANGTTNTTSTNIPYTLTVTATSSNQNSPTTSTVYAIFAEKPLFYFSASANASSGGTASVNPTTANVRGQHYNSTSATTSVTFTATPNSGYEFAGWYSDAGYTTQLNTDTPYQRNITSTSTNSGSPTNTTLYARFEPIPTFYFSASAVASPSGGGTASVSSTTANVSGAHWNSTSATTTSIAFSATANANYIFAGWSESANGTIVSTDNPYNPTLTSNSTNSASPANTTLYARFQTYATSITATPSEIVVYVGGNASDPIEHTVSPAGAYDEHTTYESSNTEIATVDASGRVTGVSTGTTTIIVRSLQNDNSTVAASTTVTVIVKNKMATPAITFESTEQGAKANITCATSGYKIYYTKNDGTPTTSSTEYSGPFSVEEGDVIQAIAVKDPTDANWDNSDVATATCNFCTTDEPEITFEGNATTGKATVTITAKTEDAIYYTQGSSPADPTPSVNDGSGTTSVTINNVSDGVTIKAIAKNSTCQVSHVVSKEIIFSYADGSTVVLEDYEDHQWSYYSDPECPVRSLSPADVKITYYGDGIVMSNDNDYTVGTNNYVSPGDPNYEGGAKVNVGGENENTFIYYKTLERGADTQTAWTFSTDHSSAASRCPYTPIPNPFQVRPTYGTRNVDANDFTGWRGFQCWRLKSVTGGAVYSVASGGTALTTGAIINAETEIYFAPNSEYGMEVELEAVWARAYLIKGNQARENAILSYNVGVERNFMTLTAGTNFQYNGTGNNTRRITNVGYPVTISCYYPSGEAPDNTSSSVGGASNQNLTLGADVKFENVGFYSLSNYTLTADGHNLIVGRGCYNTVGTVRGLSGDTSGAVEYSIRLESGTYGTFNMIDGTTHTHSGTVSAKTIFGCDYDRAKGDNDKLSISANSTVYGASSYQAFTGGGNRNNLTYDWLIKSGKVQATKGVADGAAANCIYMGNTGNGNDSDGNRYQGKRRLIMEGGEVCNISGGLNNYGNNYANYIVNDGWAVQIRMKGGTVRGSIFGAAAFAGASGDRLFIFTGGTIGGWVAGGANGTQNSGGELYGSTSLYIGGKTVIGSESGGTHVGGTSNYGTNGADGGNVFGAGCGILPANGNYQTGTVGRVDNSIVAIADETTIWRDVYGGGNYGWVRDNGTTGIYILGGTVNGSVFGGSNNQQGQEVSITMKGGTIKGNTIGDATKIGGLYGGSNSWGTINDNVTMQIDGGQVGTSSKTANIHGGGYGQSTVVSGNVDLTLGTTTQTTDGVIIHGDVYGGSALGTVNTNASNHTNVTLNEGTIYGSLYGGALGDLASLGNGHSNVAANVNGPVTVVVNGGKVIDPDDPNGTDTNPGSVFGCNNVNGSPQNTVTVTINKTDPTITDGSGNKTYALNGVYGGGNQAHYTYDNSNYPTVTVNGCESSIKDVYGGGNAAAVPSTHVLINGGDIDRVFGGGNGESGTPAHIGYQNKTDNSTGSPYTADGNVSVTINGGTINQVFGGSNAHGLIKGSNSISIEKTGTCEMHIGEVYGGGNEADGRAGTIDIGCTGGSTEGIGDVYGGANNANISNNITLNITGGRINRVFGGNNTGGTVSGTITVNVDWDGTCTDNYLYDVFGGGNQASYGSANADYPEVNIINATISHNVFGGGLGTTAVVTGDPQVTIGSTQSGKTVTISGDVYGGGDAAAVVGTPVVKVVNNCNNTIANVYGGGNAADVNGTDVTIDGGNITGMVFGGGHGDKDANPQKAANVNGDVNLSVTGGTINKVFGGSNSKGNITGDITVDVAKGTNSCDMHITEVYGGGNQAAGNAGTITIGCTGGATEGIGDVYGGANAADINNSIELNITGGRINRVFGGNNTSGNVSGSITVNIDWDGTCTENALSAVYGGGNQAAYTPTTPGSYPAVNIKNGTITGNVFGGGLGATAVVTSNPLVTVTGGSMQSVFGGGDAAGVTGNPTVSISDGTVSGAVYGGGNNIANNLGVTGNTAVNISGGTIAGGVYGGCNTQGIVSGDAELTLTGGQVGDIYTPANIHGGGYGQPTVVAGDITINYGGKTQTTGGMVLYGDLYGGSALGNVNTDTNNDTKLNLYIGSIYGSVYGGGLGQKDGFYGATSDIESLVKGNVMIDLNGYMNNTTSTATQGVGITGNVFGCNNLNGTPQGTVTVHVHKTIGIGDHQKSADKDGSSYDLTAVYGGGNLSAYVPTGTESASPAATAATVIIDGCDLTSIGYVYGGGNAASTPATNVTVNGSYEIGYLFGGGNGFDDLPNGDPNPGANVGYKAYPDNATDAEKAAAEYGTGLAQVNALGGTIHRIFGGSNTKGNVRDESVAYLDESASTCPLSIDEIYGGGNEAYMAGDAQIKLGCITYLREIYGGAKAADFGGNIKLNITSGRFDRVFGGNNVSGNISGSIEVNIEETGCHPIVIGELYGGGNQAAYSIYGYKQVTEGGNQVWKPRESANDAGTGPATPYANPEINIKSFTSIGRVYGGGYGATAVMAGDPVVNINEVKGDHNNASVATGTYTYDPTNFDADGNFNGITLTIDGHPVTIPNHDKGTIGAIGTVFGGGNAAKVIGNPHVNIGTLTTVLFETPETATQAQRTKTVEGADIRFNVFGGGNAAEVTGNTNVVVGQDSTTNQNP